MTDTFYMQKPNLIEDKVIGTFYFQFDDDQPIEISKDVKGEVSLHLSGANTSFGFTDGKGKKFKLFIK